MKKVFFASVLVLAGIGLARADSDDRPGPGWMSIAQVDSELLKMGFTDISKIEADDGLWKAKGMKNGVYTKVKLDPRDGRVVESKREREDHDDD